MASWRKKTIVEKKEHQRRQDAVEKQRSRPRAAGIIAKVPGAQIDHCVFERMPCALIHEGDGLNYHHNVAVNPNNDGVIGVESKGGNITFRASIFTGFKDGLDSDGDENLAEDLIVSRKTPSSGSGGSHGT
jgi:hypothetical protein